MAKLSDLHNAIVKGNLELAVSTTQEALQENIDPQTLISDYLIKGMEEIGTQFEAGKAYVPNLLMSARAMKGALCSLAASTNFSSETSTPRLITSNPQPSNMELTRLSKLSKKPESETMLKS